MSESLVCPKCANAMEEGFIVDHNDGSFHVAQWVRGKPEKSFWTGTKVGGKPLINVETYRCRKCGFLESYARD